MENTSLEKEVTFSDLQHLAKAEHLSMEALEYSRALSGSLPDRKDWQTFINMLLLFLGIAFFTSGVIFFFAYNWENMHKFVKLGLAQLLVLVPIVIVFIKGLDSLAGKASLFMASILAGAFLATFGQIYQTGADAYELFMGWFFLIAGWVFISRFQALWFFWLIILDFFIVLFYVQNYGDRSLDRAVIYELLFGANVLGLALWEFFAPSQKDWLKGRWFPRTLVLVALGTISFVMFICILYRRSNLATNLSPFIYIPFVLLVLFFYRFKKEDLFMLAMTCLSMIFVFTTLLSKVFVDNWEGFWFISFMVIVQVAFAGKWLHRMAKLWNK